MSHRTARSRIGVWAGLLCLVGCGEKIQEQYQVQIIGPTDSNYLTGVRTVVLEVGGKEISRTSVNEGAPFSLTGAGINPSVTSSGAVRVRGLGAGGELLVFGQTPELELILATPPTVQVFVQKPGSLGRAASLPNGRKNLVAVSAVASPNGVLRIPTAVVLFGLGDVTITDASTMALVDQPSEVLGIYNPFAHLIDDAGTTSPSGGVRQPRTEAAALARPDGQVLLFGGLAAPPMMTPRATAQLDIVRIRRADFDIFDKAAAGVRESDSAGIARIRPAMADADLAYAFGGVAGDTPLDTVVAIDPSMTNAQRLLDVKMAGPRDGLTATTVNNLGVAEILVFGGGVDPVPVAEVFVPGAAPRFEARMPMDPMTQRRDHGAVVLPSNDTVLVVGGKDNAGTVLGDSALYNARTKVLARGPINLKTPRSRFGIFIVANDLVVVGGFDAQGAPVGTAEIFDASNDMLVPKGTAPCVPRGRPAVATLSNQSAVVIGGQQPDGHGSAVIEIYQPLR